MLTEDGLTKENSDEKQLFDKFLQRRNKIDNPKLIEKLPEGIELDEERIENLAAAFPLHI